MRVPAILLVCLLFARAQAQEFVQVPDDRFGLDAEMGLLVVAMTGDEVQEQWAEVKQGVWAGELFTFEEPVAVVETGTRYDASNGAGDPVAIYFTDLPLIHITTGHEIVDEPKVPALFQLWSDQQVIQGHHIAIEIRGGSSQAHPKKSYLMEFRLHPDYEDNVNVQLLGMRSDDDWNLQAMYIEPLRLRNVIGQELWMDMHEPYYRSLAPSAMSGVRHVYAELFINGVYKGLYAVGERVDRKQLQVMPYAWGVQGAVVKGKDHGAPGLYSVPPPYEPGALYWAGFEHIYPKQQPIWPALSEFIGLVVEAPDADFHAQVGQWFRRDNAIDYHLFMNVLKAVDNTGKNIFLARFNTGEPYFYVPWDLDAIFGLHWNGSLTPGVTGLLSNGLYDRWLQDLGWSGFTHDLCMRWTELRNGPIAVESIMQRFIDKHDRLAGSGVYQREEMAWQEYEYQPGHLLYMENWIAERLGYMDSQFAMMCAEVSVEELAHLPPVRVFPNPATDRVFIELPMELLPARIEVINAMGQRVRRTAPSGTHAVLDVAGLAAGAYHIVIHRDGAAPVHHTLVVQ